MNRLAENFMEGGIFMYPIALLACALPALALTLAVVAIISKKDRSLIFGLVLLVGAVLPAAIGVLGERVSMIKADEAIRHVNPEDQATIRAAAMSESMTTTLWGYTASIVPTFVGFALLGLGLSRLPRFKS